MSSENGDRSWRKPGNRWRILADARQKVIEGSSQRRRSKDHDCSLTVGLSNVPTIQHRDSKPPSRPAIVHVPVSNDYAHASHPSLQPHCHLHLRYLACSCCWPLESRASRPSVALYSDRRCSHGHDNNIYPTWPDLSTARLGTAKSS
jgi:hypothetical protein